MVGRKSRKGSWLKQPQAISLGVFLAFLVALVLLGGSARGDMIQVVILRPLAVLALIYGILKITREQLVAIKWPLTVLGALFVYLAIQLVPLPPAIWSSLPGQASLVAVFEEIGQPLPWRPISMHTEAGFNSFLSLSVPLAGLILFATISEDRLAQFMRVVVLIAVLSLLVGIVQLLGDKPALHLYRISNFGANTGFFANRNHQALLLAMGLVALPAARMSLVNLHTPQYLLNIFTVLLFFLLTIGTFLTGSRSGLVLGIIAAVWSGYWIWQVLNAPARREHRKSRAKFSISPRSQKIALLLSGLLVVGVAIASPQQVVLERLSDTESNLEGDKRVNIAGNTVEMIGDYLPLGGGAGSFPSVYREYEGRDELSFRYINHAHNDLLEVVYEVGLIAPILGIVVLIGLFRGIVRSFPPTSERNLIANSFALIIGMAITASALDYPVRTPLLATLVVICMAGLARASRGNRSEAQSTSGPSKSD